MAKQLPRVTYSNPHDDFSAVHAQLQERLQGFREYMLGWGWASCVGGLYQSGGMPFAAFSPIDRRVQLGTFPMADASLVQRAVEGARGAFSFWKDTTWRERADLLRKVGDEIENRKIDLALGAVLEIGKSRMEAMGEVEEAADLARYYAGQLEQNEGFVRPLKQAFAQESTADILRPIGVFGVIAPFNFPIALAVNMITGALATGNTVIFKPSLAACMTGAMVYDAFIAAGVPGGVINLIFGGRPTGELMVKHAGIDGIAFTGSHEVGMSILRTVATGRFIRPAILEMGGKNPAYVTASADLDAAAEGVMRSAFGLQGQKCSAASKVYVHADVKDAFLEKLLARTSAVKIGDPTEADVFMGPLINDNALSRYRAVTTEAMETGNILAGGQTLSGDAYEHGAYVMPTVVENIPADHRINRDELFLPFLSVLSFTELSEAIADGNNVIYGLTAGCYARDEAELALFLERAEAGVLYANRASGATTGAWPGVQSFCGWKGSGATAKGGLGPYYLAQFMREQSRTVWNDAPAKAPKAKPASPSRAAKGAKAEPAKAAKGKPKRK